MNIISLGAGVQSSTMALMAACGEIEPMPDCAIFADTQAEPKAVYEWLDRLEKELPFPVYRVTAGSLKQQLMEDGPTWGRPPFFTQSGGMVRRQCTGDFKIAPIRRRIRTMTYIPPVTLWIGISLDEASRMKDSDVLYIKHRWPLIEKRIRRNVCVSWLENHGFPEPAKSACTFCPYHNDRGWRDMKQKAIMLGLTPNPTGGIPHNNNVGVLPIFISRVRVLVGANPWWNPCCG